MADMNLNYGYASDALPVGSVADSRHTHTSTVDSPTEEILPGQPVGWNGAVLSAVGQAMRGVARWTTTMVQTDAGAIGWKIGKPMPVVSFGPVWVNIVGAVNAGDPLFAIISGGDKGKYTKTSGATTTTKAVGISETTLAATGQGILFVQYNPAAA